MSDKQKEATDLIVDQLVQSGIKLVASLPDDWIAPLINAIDTDERFKHVHVNREEAESGLRGLMGRARAEPAEAESNLHAGILSRELLTADYAD